MEKKIPESVEKIIIEVIEKNKDPFKGLRALEAYVTEKNIESLVKYRCPICEKKLKDVTVGHADFGSHFTSASEGCFECEDCNFIAGYLWTDRQGITLLTKDEGGVLFHGGTRFMQVKRDQKEIAKNIIYEYLVGKFHNFVLSEKYQKYKK